MTIQEKRTKLHQLADEIDGSHIDVALEFLVMLRRNGAASSADRSPHEPQRSEEADRPLWGIAGIGRSIVPSNIAKHKDEYIADAFSVSRS